MPATVTPIRPGIVTEPVVPVAPKLPCPVCGIADYVDWGCNGCHTPFHEPCFWRIAPLAQWQQYLRELAGPLDPATDFPIITPARCGACRAKVGA